MRPSASLFWWWAPTPQKEFLLLESAVLYKPFCSEDTVVCSVSFDLDADHCCLLFKDMLAFDGGLNARWLLRPCESISCGVVHVQYHTFVFVFGVAAIDGY